MTWLLVVYLAIGTVCAAMGYERAPKRDVRALLAALVTLAIWPLWAPFALLPAPRRRR
jgi:hypothetical protein